MISQKTNNAHLILNDKAQLTAQTQPGGHQTQNTTTYQKGHFFTQYPQNIMEIQSRIALLIPIRAQNPHKAVYLHVFAFIYLR